MSNPYQIYVYLIILFALGTGNGNAEIASEQPILHVVGWDVYADPEYINKTIGYESFEKEFGYKIDFTPLTNLDEIIHYAETHKEIDVLIVSNEGIKILFEKNLLSDLDLKKVPFYQDLHNRLKYTEWSQFDGKFYAVPWAWGPTGLLYDSERLSEPKSWNVLWDPEYKGKVSLWNDISMIWITALSLGYTNVYNLTDEQLDEVRKKIRQLNDQVYGYYRGEKEEIKYLISGKVLITNSWFDPSARLRKNNKKFKMVIPKEGAVGMFDSYLLSRACKLKEVALSYVNHQISPEVQLKMSRITGLAPANIETLALMKQDEIHLLHLNEQDYFKKMILWDVMPRKYLYENLLDEINKDLKNKNLN